MALSVVRFLSDRYAGGLQLPDENYGTSIYSPLIAAGFKKLYTYATNLIRIRRDSDNAELDIACIGNDLDTASISAHCIKTGTLTNVLGTNGNFVSDSNSDGLGDGWTNSSMGTLSMTGNVQTMTASAQYSYIRRTVTGLTVGQKLYACAYINCSGVCNFFLGTTQANHTGSGAYEFLSVLITGSATSHVVDIKDSRASGFTPINAKLVHVFNLTAIFGAGNEPSKAEMDNYITSLAGSYVESQSATLGDGYVVKVYNQMNPGTHDLVQSTAARQPKICSLGSVLLDNNNQPYCETGSTQSTIKRFLITDNAALKFTTNLTCMVVHTPSNWTGFSTNESLISKNNGVDYAFGIITQGPTTSHGLRFMASSTDYTANATSVYPDIQTLSTVEFDSSLANNNIMFKNGFEEVGSGDLASNLGTSSTDLVVLSNSDNTKQYVGKFYALMIFNVSLNVSDINTSYIKGLMRMYSL